MLSARVVEGSVDDGERRVSGAGVLGGNDSRLMSTVETGSGAGSVGTSGGVIVRLMARRPRDLAVGGFLFCGFSFSSADERCFLGDRTGSVLTGSAKVN